MKLSGIDLSAKWIYFELDGTDYSIHFKSGFFKGIYDIEVKAYTETNKKSNRIKVAKIENSYPSLPRRIKELGIMPPIFKSIKWIFFELEGTRYSIFFRDTFIMGTHDVKVSSHTKTKEKQFTLEDIKLRGTYPHLPRRIREFMVMRRIFKRAKKL